MTWPHPIRFVLDRTTHPGNIGAAARAMKVMGLTELHLVAPRSFPHAEATAMASSADDLLAAAAVHADLESALEGCRLVLGTTARQRTVSREPIAPREAARRVLREAGGPVAVVFGTEKSGLDNDAVARCHYLVNIPTGAEYQSLNLAQAVQVMAYELRLAAEAPETASGAEHRPAAMERMEAFFRNLEATLRVIRHANPDQTRTLHRRLRRLFLRARPDDDELNILQGILSSARKASRYRDEQEESQSGD